MARPEKIGPYEVQREIGRGGMGVVYLGRDPRLDRDVAIKVLPRAFARDAEGLARFEREAKLLAALHHSNLAVVYGLEHDGDRDWLILEYVPGEGLDERLARGAPPPEEAIEIARQIAAALAAAHERGVIHRDLKPSNVRLAPDGRVKVLDFGLAKAFAAPDPHAGEAPPEGTVDPSPTTTGAVLGTAGYMSPEQARGRPVDRRTDVWAFGCLLFEMLAGRRAFPGETPSDALAATLQNDPPWSALSDATPPRIRWLLRRCLAKDPTRRLHEIADARVELDEVLADPTASSLRFDAPRGAPRSGGPGALLVLATVLLTLAVAIVSYVSRGPQSPAPGARAQCVDLALPADEPLVLGAFRSLAVSPDGRRVAAVAGPDAEHRRLIERGIDSFGWRALDGTDGAENPFFSPDGRWIGFFADGWLHTVPVAGGAAVRIAPVTNGIGGSWTPDGRIVYAPAWSGGLWIVSAEGGDPAPLTEPDEAAGEASHRWPHVTPDGRRVVFTVKTADLDSFDDARIAVAAIDGTGAPRTVVTGGHDGRIGTDGRLAYARAGALLAVAVDRDTFEPRGAPEVILDDVVTDPWFGIAHAALAGESTVYVAGGPRRRDARLVWVDADGARTPITDDALARPYVAPVLAPDGARIAVTVATANDNLWVYDLERATLNRLTYGAGNNWEATWSPDGRSITFASDRAGTEDVWRVPIDGSAEPQRLVDGPPSQVPSSWAPDGSALCYTQVEADRAADVWVLPIDGAPVPFAHTPFHEAGGVFAPDGGWIAYHTDESGRNEVYVRAYPGPGPRAQASRDGGAWPVWSRDGTRLLFRRGDAVYAATFTPAADGGTPRIGPPRLVADGDYARENEPGFDVAEDGRLLMVAPVAHEAPVRAVRLLRR